MLAFSDRNPVFFRQKGKKGPFFSGLSVFFLFLLLSSSLLLPALLAGEAFFVGDAHASGEREGGWWNRDWEYRIPVTVRDAADHDHTPFLVDLWLDLSKYDVANFTAECRITELFPSGEKEIPFQVVNDRNINGRSYEARVVFPVENLRAGETIAFYIYFGNPGVQPSTLQRDFHPETIKNTLYNPTPENNNYRLSGPTDVFVDETGKMYVADRGNQRVQIYDSDGRYVMSLGVFERAGSDTAHLNHPSGVWVSETTGYIYVADEGNNRVQVFSSSGAYVDTFSANLSSPYDVAVDENGRVFVSDTDNNRVVVFAQNGSVAGEIKDAYGVPLRYPGGLWFDSGVLFVVDTGNHRVVLFNATFQPIDMIGKGTLGTGHGEFSFPSNVVVHGRRVFVSDTGNKRIEVFDKNSLSYLYSVESSSTGEETFMETPRGIFVSDGTVLVADQGTNRVLSFSSSGALISSFGFGASPLSPFSLKNPRAVDVSPNGTVYVADWGNHRVVAYSSTGGHLFTIGVPGEIGSDVFHLANPNDVVFHDGDLFVADRYNNRVQVFNATNGMFEQTLGGVDGGTESYGGFNQPCGLAVDEEGRIYVADTYNNRVLLFNSAGEFVSEIGNGQGTGPGEFRHPYDIEIYGNMIYILDTDNFRVEVFYKQNLTYAGTLLSGSPGLGPYDVRWPCGFDIRDGKMAIADTYNQRVQVYIITAPLNVTYLFTIGTNGTVGVDNQHFMRPRKVDIGPDGKIYVADADNNRIQVYSENGEHLSTIGAEMQPVYDDFSLASPTDVSVDREGNIYVADKNNHRVQVFSPMGEHVMTFGSREKREAGSDNNHLFVPGGVSVSGDIVYIADTGNARVQVFNTTGEYLKTIDVDCYSVEVDSGRIYYAEAPFHAILITSEEGETIQLFGTPGESGTDMEHLNFPLAVDADSDGNVYVADTGNHRVVIYRGVEDRVGDEVWGETGVKGTDITHFSSPEGIAVWNNMVFVSDTGNSRIQVFTTEGEYLFTLGVSGESGVDNSHFSMPDGIFVADDGTVYVADTGNNRIVRIVNAEVETGTMEKKPVQVPWYVRGFGPFPIPLWILFSLFLISTLIFLTAFKSRHKKEMGVFPFKKGVFYRTESPEALYGIYKQAVAGNMPGLIISRTPPDVLVEKYNLSPALLGGSSARESPTRETGKAEEGAEKKEKKRREELYWLTNTPGKNTVSPGDINRLLFLVNRFAKENPGGIVVLDGMDAISTRLPEEKFVDVVGRLKEIAALGGIYLFGRFNMRAYDEKTLALIEEETEKAPELEKT